MSYSSPRFPSPVKSFGYFLLIMSASSSVVLGLL